MKDLFSFKNMIFVVAMFIAMCAAIFSVSGIGKLFAGSSLAVIIMASSLELGKIVSVSFLYRFWKSITRTLKVYMITASAVLMLITSLGIYGFLSGAYQDTADKISLIEQQTSVLELKKQRFQDQLDVAIEDRNRLGTSIQELNRGLANNVIQYRDSASGEIITTTSGATRVALQQQLRSAQDEREALNNRILELTDSVTSLDVQILEASNVADLGAEVGPLRFLSRITGMGMDTIVNIFTIMIVLVFDPLAIALIIGYNFLVEKDSKSSTRKASQEDIPEENELEHLPETDSPINDPGSAAPVHRDKQFFARSGFNWDNEALWKGNKHAEAYYERYIKNR